MSSSLLYRSLALEEDQVDGKIANEIEHVFYARLTDPSQLDLAKSKESQEQWEIKIPKTDENAAQGRMRVRKIVIPGHADPQYVFTTKLTYGVGKSKEVSLPTTVDQFEAFKTLASAGMIKTRYNFPVEGSDAIWEIDVFQKPEGGNFEWVKIDLEVKNINDPVPNFPIDLANIIDGRPDFHSEDEEAKIRSLYSTEFLTKNPYLHEAPGEGL